MRQRMLLLSVITGAWIQIESPRFVVRTDLPEVKARALLEKLEHDVVDMNDVPQLALLQLPERQRLVLNVFANAKDFDAVFKWEPTSGPRFTTRQMLSGEDKLRIYFTADIAGEQAAAIARRMLKETLGDLMETPPLWLELGLEMYAAMAKREEAQWLLGMPPELTMTGEVPALDQLLQVTDEFKLSGEVEKRRIEVCAWHLVHLLMQGTADYPVSPEHMQRLAQWYTSLRAGLDPAASLLKAFAPLDLAGMYAAHFKAPKLAVSRSPAKPRPLTAKPPIALPAGIVQPPGDTAQAVLLNTPALKAEGHVNVAMASTNVATRRKELQEAMTASPTEWALVAMALRNELSYEGAEEVTCREAKPLATKLLSAPLPRHKSLARETVLGCAKKPPTPPETTMLARPPTMVSGDKQPSIPPDILQSVKGKAGNIIAKVRVAKDGGVSGVYIVRSTIPEMNKPVADLLTSWKFMPGNSRFEFLQPFTFNFAAKKSPQP